jgi:hypothetical protein
VLGRTHQPGAQVVRTYALLEHAAPLYCGKLEIAGYLIAQGSCLDIVPAGIVTHKGGGAVDPFLVCKGTSTECCFMLRKFHSLLN